MTSGDVDGSHAPIDAGAAFDADAEVRDALAGVAPDVDVASVDGAADLGDACDIDSMDFLALIEDLSRRVGTPVPPGEYPRLRTLNALAAWARAARGG